MIEIDTLRASTAKGERVAAERSSASTRCVAAPLAPALMPQPDAGATGVAVLDPDAVFLNARRAQRLGMRLAPTATAARADAHRQRRLRVRGSVAAAGAALAVMDIAGAQAQLRRARPR